ncbi:MAG: hypothetical protein GW949_07820 [Spirochaetales bacterium]|nr:hypothetical protein [Spirochaetales bacterium]
MMAQNRSADGLTSFLLQLSVGMYLSFLGIRGIANYDSDTARIGRAVSDLFGASNSPLGLVIGIAQLVVGVLLLIGLFIFAKRSAQTLLGLASTGLWGAFMLYQHFIQVSIFAPDTLTWFTRFAFDLVILAALFGVAGRKSRN